MLDQITPIILTYNEAPNLRRTLNAVRWARDIVVVDSFSDDTTLTIAAEFRQVRVFQRHFDCHQDQWNFALKETGITSEWVLALDADYVLTPESVEEMKVLQPSAGVNSYQARFVYCVHGKPLRGSAYPPVTVLYRRERATYQQDGHTQRVVIDGAVGELHSPILHDDRKPLTHWLKSQDRYMRLEIDHLRDKQRGARGMEQGARLGRPEIRDQKSEVSRGQEAGRREATPSEVRDQRSELSAQQGARTLGLPDRLRKTRVLFPFVIFFYCLFVKGGIRDGWAGVYYAFQRMLAEILLALYLIEDDLKPEVSGRRSEVSGQWSDIRSQWSDIGGQKSGIRRLHRGGAEYAETESR